MKIPYSIQFDNISVSHMNETCIGNNSFKTHSHSFYEFLFFPNAPSVFVVENERIAINYNSGFLIRPAQLHYMSSIESPTFDGYMIRFSPEVISQNLKNKLVGINAYFTSHSDTFLSILEKLDFYVGKFSGEDLHDLCISTLTELLHELLVILDQSQAELSNKKMVDILDYINSNISDKITLDSLCKQFYQSKTWLYHAFMENVGMPPIKYIESKRLALANELILTGNKPTKIYSTCGYSDYSAFYRAYIAYYGHPPTTVKPKKSAKRSKKASTKKQVEQ